jgi:predicted MFS family arabinose efflux permease
VVVRRIAPLRLAALGVLAFALPLWILPFPPPWPVVLVALFVATFFTPLVNGRAVAVLTARTPVDLRPMVLTAVVSANTLVAPLGYLVAGQVLERWGIAPLFGALAVGVTCVAIAFATVTWRRSDPTVLPGAAVESLPLG